MNSVNSKTASLFTKIVIGTFVFLPAIAWEVDMSRRQLDFERIEDKSRMPASEEKVLPVFDLEQLALPSMPTQDVVLLNTDKGFVPEKIYVRKGESYRIHLVNVNPEKKNVSFILDEFAESHSTPYAKTKVFELKPQKVGEFSFHSPETSYRGRVIVIDSQRKPASK